MSLRFVILSLLVAVVSTVVVGQTVELPDSLFGPSAGGLHLGLGGKELPSTVVPEQTVEPLFMTPPAVTFKDYMEAPARSDSPLFMELPDVPSEFFMHVLLLHLSKVKIPGLDEELERYRIMLENFNRNLYGGGNYSTPYVPALVKDHFGASVGGLSGGSGLVFSGCLDPVEAYRRYMQQKRLERARQVIKEFEGDELPTRDQTEGRKSVKIRLPDLLKEENFDVKVKADGDNPPYRP